jgi:hypothetical protein
MAGELHGRAGRRPTSRRFTRRSNPSGQERLMARRQNEILPSKMTPFLRLRPRPAGAYGIASERAILGDRPPTVALFGELLANFAIDANRD